MFSINKDTRIFLYGAASIGKIVYENLYAKGIEAAGFIDKRADEIDVFLGKPVYKFEKFLSDQPEDTVVVVSVKNVFEHDSIAEKFINNGFCNLIFKPKSVLENRASAEEIRVGRIYDAMLDGSQVDMVNICSITKLAGYFYKDYALVREDGEDCIALLPMSLLFTNNYDPEQHKWGNVNLYSFFTHDDFFQSLEGNTSKSSKLYVDEYCVYSAKQQKDITITEKWRENVVANRTMIYEQMRLSLEIDPGFFYRNPATATWNQKRKYFNLTSGKHRCMFLVSKGYYYLPVRISKNDYSDWCRKEVVEQLWLTMQSKGYNSYDGIVSHPNFYKYSSIGWVFVASCIHEINNALAKKIYLQRNKVDYVGITMLDKMDSLHSISRYFAHMGAFIYREKSKEIEKYIDKIENVSVSEDVAEVESIDVVFLTIKEESELLALERQEGVTYFVFSETGLRAKELTKGYIAGKYHYLYNL